ncbi:hypothetical protein ACFX13_034424 [Malus domestica]|nr:uncharacterized protein LOC114824467 [Malus domestica]
MATKITLDYVRKLQVESFTKMLAEVKAVAKNRDEELSMLEQKVLLDLFQNKGKKSTESKKRKAASASNNQKIKKHNFGSSSRSMQDEYVYYKDCDEEDHEKKARTKKQKTAKKAESVKLSSPSIPLPPPELPKEFKEKIESMHGFQVQLMIQKQLFKTDLSYGHDRLSMPRNQVVNKHFLGEHEKRLENGRVLEVKVIDSGLKERKLWLAKWFTHTQSSFSYVLGRGWRTILKDEEVGLNENDVIQVWSFRYIDPNPDIKKEGLGFALVKIRGDGKKDFNDGTSIERQQVIESAITKKDVNGSTSTDRQEAFVSQLIKTDEMETDANVSTGTETTEPVDLAMIKKEESKKDSICSTASEEAIESSKAKNKSLQAAVKAMKHVSLNLKFRNVTFRQIKTYVSVV